VSSFLGFDILTPRRVMKVTFDMMQLSAEAMKVLLPGRDSRVVWQEFQNKLEAYDLFANVDSVLGLDAEAGAPLAELVGRTRSLDAYRAVWATEGVGHYHAESFWDRTGAPSNLLRGPHAGALPAKSLTPLHTGMGLSLAERFLSAAGPRSLHDSLRQYFELCRDNSMPGYVGASYEALGLVARNLYPHLVPSIDPHLRGMDEGLIGYFWHGVGRALYFAPTNFIPFNNSPWRAVEMARREPAHETGRLNAAAGVAWAMTLVNIRQPEIIEAFLNCHRGELSRSDAVSNGVSSAVMIWRDAAGGDAHIEALCRHRPEPSLSELWAEQVARPCRDALRRFYPVLQKHDCLGELFRYQSLPGLVARLEKGRAHGRHAASPGERTRRAR
jgi:hypothetical protein